MQQKQLRHGKVFDRKVMMIFLLVLGLGLFIMVPAMTQPAPSIEAGQTLFQQSCAACHSIGQGDLVGPDLEGVVEKRDRDWLIRWLMVPDQMVAEGDSLALEILQQYNNIPMPNLGITEAQAVDLIAYMGGDAQTPDTSTDPTTAISGDTVLGRNLFTGSVAFQNGGPSCMACHSIAGNGALGGGTLGPDLTKVHTRFNGQAGLTAALKGLPFPTMQGIFNDKPLTDNEVAHLYAYFALTDQIAPEPVNWNFVWIGLGVFIALTILCHLIWNKRLAGVRKPLLGGMK